jgi:RNA-directed DNA polymerase
VMVSGTKAHAEDLRDQVAAVLSPMGLRLSEEKTVTVGIDEGFDFLGFRIQRQTKRGSNRAFVYTWPSKKALASVTAKVKKITRQGTNHPLTTLLRRLNPVLRGWTNYFRHGVSKATFGYLHQFTWQRVVGWLRRKHRRANWKWLRRRYLANAWWPEHDGMALFDCRAVPVTRYRYRGAAILTPGAGGRRRRSRSREGLVESRMRWKSHVRFGGRAGETDRWEQRHGAPVRSHLANEALSGCRRRVQQETLGHRGRKGDPLYGVRRLLLLGAERVDERGWSRIHAALDAGDPDDEVRDCWVAKEKVRDVYLTDDADLAAERLDDAVAWCTAAESGPELRRLAKTLRRWRTEILAHHSTGASNGPVEAANLLIKQVKRSGRGFRNFDNYRLRILLADGMRRCQTSSVTSIRTRRPRLVA